MSRDRLERQQVWIYFAAILVGMGLSSSLPGLGDRLETLLWPTLGLLLFTTFTQVPLARLPHALGDRRFLAAAVVGNFLLVPLLAWGLVQLLPDSPPLRLGVLLVLLVPCTNWFMTFAQLGRGDGRRAIAVTPVNLGLQLVLVPLYLWLMLDHELVMAFDTRGRATVVLGLLLTPLALVFALQRRAARRRAVSRWLERLGWWPVPLLALVVFLIAASQVQVVLGAPGELGRVAAVFVGFLFGAHGLFVAHGGSRGRTTTARCL